MNKFIQCCYCKSDSERFKDVVFFNIENRISNGCSNCKNYYEITYPLDKRITKC